MQALAKIAEQYGFPPEQPDQYLALMQGKPCVLTGGLLYKMEKKFGDKYTVKAVLPPPEHVELFKDMMGVDGPLVVIKGVVETEHGTFEDWGTASPRNLKGFVKFEDYGVEMASRRATNRAMRLATNIGLTSVDELPGGDTTGGQSNHAYRPTGDSEKPPGKPVPGRQVSMASDAEIKAFKGRLNSAVRDGYLTQEQFNTARTKVAGPTPTELLDTLMAHLDRVIAEKNAQAEAEGKAMEGAHA